MPRGFRGYGGFGGFFGRGWGVGGWPGNPYPFCRRFPWLPRWWWAYSNMGYPYSGGYGAYPYRGGYRRFPWGPGYYGPSAPYPYYQRTPYPYY